MSEFTKIDLNTWERRELFKLYTDLWGAVQWSFTKQVDVTKLVAKAKEKNVKFTACLMYVINSALNKRMNWKIRKVDGELGYFDEIHPTFPVLTDSGIFNYHTVEYHKDFNEFYKGYLEEQVKYPKNEIYPYAHTVTPPVNNFIISILNYFSYDANSVILKYPQSYFSPIVIVGKYENVDGKLMLPISVSMNHACADGHHMNLFILDLEDEIKNF